jgi:pimeloyl-ACP methyl ester carboxylesterase
MRETPDRIRSVVLDSTLPPQVHAQSEIGRNFESAFGVIVESCRSDAACNAAYPNFERDYWENVRRANEDPIEVTIRDRNDMPVELHLSGSILISGTFVAMYSTSIARVLPFATDLVERGEHGVLQVVAQELVFVFSGFADGMTLSVDCNEEVPFVTAEKLNAGNAGVRPEVIAADVGNISTETSRRSAVALCENWGTPPPDPVETLPVRSSIPTLILAGEHDPITPPRYGALAAETLSNSFFFEFPSSGHGVFYHHWECGTGMIDAFLARPRVQPDASCIDAIPPMYFAIDTAPASPPTPSIIPGRPGPDGILAPDTGSGPQSDGALPLMVSLCAGIAGVLMLVAAARLKRLA